MTKTLLETIALAAASALVWVAPANAQSTRTWVSGLGNDANACTREAPCKTWVGAIANTAPCGEIDALDPGGFGALAITVGLTIDGGGGQVASVLASNTNGFTIANTSASCPDVIIRNVSFQGMAPGASPGLTGIKVTQGSLILDHVKIQNFSQGCVDFQSTTAATLTVIDSDFADCGPAALEVGYAGGGGKVSTASVTHSTFEGSAVGVLADAFGRIALHDSMISSNSTGGIEANGSDAWVQVDNSSLTGNGSYAVYATAAGAVVASGNTLTYTAGTAFKSDTGGHIVTFNNNAPYFYGALGATTTVGAPK